MSPDTVVACPRCGTPAVYSAANRWRPFCSERCKLIDLGDWAAERYRVAEAAPAEPDSDPDAGSDGVEPV